MLGRELLVVYTLNYLILRSFSAHGTGPSNEMSQILEGHNEIIDEQSAAGYRP